MREQVVPAKNEEGFLNVAEAAAFLKVKADTIYAWVHKRRIPFRKHGSRLIFSRRDLEAWSRTQSVPPTSLNEAPTSCTRKEVPKFFDKTHNFATDPPEEGGDDE